MADIYRKSAPGQRGSDRTDQVMTVHTPAHWFLLAGLVLVFSGFMLWACFGTLSKTTTTTGLYHPGGSGYRGPSAMSIPIRPLQTTCSRFWRMSCW